MIEKNYEGTKGITLVTLVITVVVLLILAGISILMLKGENGIIAEAVKAKKNMNLSSAREIANLAYMDAYINNYLGQDVDVMTTVKKALQGANYEIKEFDSSDVGITDVKLIDENGNEVESSLKIPIGEDSKQLTVKTEKSENNIYYVLIDGMYYQIENTRNGVNIKDEGKKESELGLNVEESITMSLTNLVGLVEINGVLLTEDTATIKDTDVITINSQSTEIEGSIQILSHNVSKDINVIIKYIVKATSIVLSGDDIYTLTIDGTETKHMAMNTGIENSIQLTSTIEPLNSEDDILWKSEDSEILTVSSNGTLTGLKEGTTKIIVTTSISGKTDEVEVTVTQYGEPVNYSVEVEGITLDDWKIFYKEGSNTFLIYGDYLPNAILGNGTEGTIKASTKMAGYDTYRLNWNSVPPFETISDEILSLYKATQYGLDSSYTNSQCVCSLLNTSNWQSFLTDKLKSKAGENNVSAIGSPTIEMWMESWKDVYPRDTVGYRKSTSDPSYGYQVTNGVGSYEDVAILNSKAGYGNKLYYPYNKILDNGSCYGYLLASPSSYNASNIMNISYAGNVSYTLYRSKSAANYALRPVICIPSNIIGDKDSTGTWQLKLD